MPEQANIWQKRLRRGTMFADFCLFLSHLSTEVPELGQNVYRVSDIILIGSEEKQAKICEKLILLQPFLPYVCVFWHVKVV